MNPNVRYYSVIAYLIFPNEIFCRAAVIGSVEELTPETFPREKALSRFIARYDRRGYERVLMFSNDVGREVYAEWMWESYCDAHNWAKRKLQGSTRTIANKEPIALIVGLRDTEVSPTSFANMR